MKLTAKQRIVEGMVASILGALIFGWLVLMYTTYNSKSQ